MSATVLREAAALMRERAKAAVVEPWDAILDTHDDYLLRGTVVTRGIPGERDIVCEHANDAAAHIASWDPVVALAVADLLTAFSMMPSASDPTDLKVALAVATAYLGSTS